MTSCDDELPPETNPLDTSLNEGLESSRIRAQHQVIVNDPITRFWMKHPFIMMPIFFLIGLPVILVKKITEFLHPKPRD